MDLLRSKEGPYKLYITNGIGIYNPLMRIAYDFFVEVIKEKAPELYNQPLGARKVEIRGVWEKTSEDHDSSWAQQCFGIVHFYGKTGLIATVYADGQRSKESDRGHITKRGWKIKRAELFGNADDLANVEIIIPSGKDAN